MVCVCTWVSFEEYVYICVHTHGYLLWSVCTCVCTLVPTVECVCVSIHMHTQAPVCGMCECVHKTSGAVLCPAMDAGYTIVDSA